MLLFVQRLKMQIEFPLSACSQKNTNWFKASFLKFYELNLIVGNLTSRSISPGNSFWNIHWTSASSGVLRKRFIRLKLNGWQFFTHQDDPVAFIFGDDY